MEPLASHEKIFVDSEFTEDENHGELTCEECHGGNPNEPDWKKAHKGVVKDPSYPDPSQTCGSCHEDIAATYQNSLHISLSPFKKMIDQRANPAVDIYAKVNAARKSHCSSCHSSCGQCHISRPEAVEGGLLEAHLFQRKPPMQSVCTACHGSRIEKEYFGKNEGLEPDIHKEKYFKCNKCHTAEEMHGDMVDYDNRYQVENGPECLDCHEAIFEPKADNARNHWIHKGLVGCHVCHSQPYKNCYSCHLGEDKHGLTYFKTEGSFINFKIGFNPLRSKRRPEKFVTVRHVPVDQDTFEFYAKDAFKNFNSLPTWKMATPHNIRRKTPQNRKCNACHGNEDLFLLKKDVKDKYLNANKDVIVPMDRIPKKRRND